MLLFRFHRVELSSASHTSNAFLLPNVAQEISLRTVVFALLSDNSIKFQIPFAQRRVFFLKCLKCCILLLNRLLNSRVDSLDFHFMVFVDILQLILDLISRLLFQIVFFGGKFIAELEKKDEKIENENQIERKNSLNICNGKLMNREKVSALKSSKKFQLFEVSELQFSGFLFTIFPPPFNNGKQNCTTAIITNCLCIHSREQEIFFLINWIARTKKVSFSGRRKKLKMEISSRCW